MHLCGPNEDKRRNKKAYCDLKLYVRALGVWTSITYGNVEVDLVAFVVISRQWIKNEICCPGEWLFTKFIKFGEFD